MRWSGDRRVRSTSCQPPSTFERALWRRQDAEDQVRWEAQLRQMSKRAMRCSGPIVVSPSVIARRVLEVVGGMAHHDALLISRSLPLFSGSEPEDLACGNCAGTIGSRIGLQSARRRHPEGVRLLVRCTCGALNLLFQPLGWRSPKARGKRSAAATSAPSAHQWHASRRHGGPPAITDAKALRTPAEAGAASRSPSLGR